MRERIGVDFFKHLCNMWDVYDIIHYLCNFLSQEDETSLLSATKYINDAVLYFRYRFTTKWYRTSIPICGKIRSLIDNLYVKAGDVAPCMDTLASVKNVMVGSRNLNINLSLTRSLKTLKLRETHDALPPMNGLVSLNIGICRSRNRIILPQSLTKYEGLHSRINHDQMMFPIGITKINITGFRGTTNIKSLVNLIDVVMNNDKDLPRDIFPESVTRIKIYGRKDAWNLHGVVWPPRLETLIASLISGIDTWTLPKTLVQLEGSFGLDHPLPNIRQLKVVSISSTALAALDPERVTEFRIKMITREFMDFVKKSKMTSLTMPVCMDITNLYDDIPTTVKALVLHRGTEHDLLRKPPNVEWLTIMRCYHEHRMLVIPPDTKRISVIGTNLISFIPNKVLNIVHIHNCNLGNIEDLPDCVQIVHVDHNHITKISRYPKALKKIVISFNPITSLASFRRTRVKHIRAEGLSQFTGPILLPSTTKKLYIGGTSPSLIERSDGKMPVVYHKQIRSWETERLP